MAGGCWQGSYNSWEKLFIRVDSSLLLLRFLLAFSNCSSGYSRLALRLLADVTNCYNQIRICVYIVFSCTFVDSFAWYFEPQQLYFCTNKNRIFVISKTSHWQVERDHPALNYFPSRKAHRWVVGKAVVVAIGIEDLVIMMMTFNNTRSVAHIVAS